jgi:hypothetical protein
VKAGPVLIWLLLALDRFASVRRIQDRGMRQTGVRIVRHIYREYVRRMQSALILAEQREVAL